MFLPAQRMYACRGSAAVGYCLLLLLSLDPTMVAGDEGHRHTKACQVV